MRRQIVFNVEALRSFRISIRQRAVFVYNVQLVRVFRRTAQRALHVQQRIRILQMGPHAGYVLVEHQLTVTARDVILARVQTLARTARMSVQRVKSHL